MIMIFQNEVRDIPLFESKYIFKMCVPLMFLVIFLES
jgi:hypothetical protein